MEQQLDEGAAQRVVIDLRAWVEPSSRLEALCSEATEVFGDPDGHGDERLVAIRDELAVVLATLQSLPRLPGPLGRAVDAVTHVHDHDPAVVHDAIAQIGRLGALLTDPPHQPPQQHQQQNTQEQQEQQEQQDQPAVPCQPGADAHEGSGRS